MVAATVKLFSMTQEALAYWKADIDSAYRRIPTRRWERWAMWIVFLFQGVPMAACNNTMPFGSVGSVHAWDRIGFFLRHCARELFHLTVFRYVDDYFGVDYASTAEHAMQCFARLTRAVLGLGAVAPAKLASGMPLSVLGLSVKVTHE